MLHHDIGVMHIPDGYLDPGTALLMFALTGAFWAVSLWRTSRAFEDKHVPLLGVLTAAVFVAQMLNWPIPGGTSAHLVGGSLVAIFLGPSAGIVSMSIVLLIQAFFFNDGGITALGANIWNMGVVDCIVGYYVYKGVSKALGGTDRAKAVGAFLGGWLGIAVGAFFCGVEIGASTQFPYTMALTVPVMTFWHGVLGLVEGAVTSSVVLYTLKSRPDLLNLSKSELI